MTSDEETDRAYYFDAWSPHGMDDGWGISYWLSSTLSAMTVLF